VETIGRLKVRTGVGKDAEAWTVNRGFGPASRAENRGNMGSAIPFCPGPELPVIPGLFWLILPPRVWCTQ